jgi:Ion channel
MVPVSVSSDAGAGAANIWIGVVLAFAIVAIVRNVLSFSTVTLQSIYGAISAYLSIGLMFAAFFAAINHLDGAHFFADAEPATTQTLQYFSFVTLTTLGYGDFTAAGSGGRAVAVL